eukprot:3167430-Alexandrium_andersonii.AAC.1
MPHVLSIGVGAPRALRTTKAIDMLNIVLSPQPEAPHALQQYSVLRTNALIDCSEGSPIWEG